MDQLEAFLKRFGRRRNVRHWLGPRPAVRDKALARAIASQVGYPTSDNGWAQDRELRSIDRGTAAQLLAFVATESLPYGRHGPPREGYRKAAAEALEAFGPDAVFLTNTVAWVSGEGPLGWAAKLTTATFEAGLIAYDRDNAMIFWVEDED